MALKYYFEFTDVKEVLHRCEISDENFTGDATLVYGNLATNKANTKDTLEVIRGGGLTINLEANLDLTFEDFYSDNERTFLVKYFRSGVLEFIGWLSPEGLFQSYVEDKWIISLDCTDGLGFLKNLSYVENNGTPYNGKQSVLEVIVNCLKRTNIEQNIYTYIDVRYDNQPALTDTFAETFINVDRFIKDDNETIMNCDEVLRSIFDLFACCITQYRGEWVIYKPNILKDTTSLTYYSYDYNGDALTPATKTIDIAFTLGSQINNYYPHHINGNQQISIDSGIGAFRINYKYGLVKSLLDNPTLKNVSGVIDGWTILDPLSNIILPPSEATGVYFNYGTTIVETGTLTSDSVIVSTSDVLSLTIFVEMILSFTGVFNYTVKVSDEPLPSGTATTYYLQDDYTWTTTSNKMGVEFGQNDLKIETKIENIPINGYLYVIINIPTDFPDTPTVGQIKVNEIILTGLDTGNILGIKGENHTFQFNTSDISTKIEDTKELFNGDLPTDLYFGTIYQNDEETPTENWNRGNVRDIPLLRYAGEERMAMYSKPLRVFTGDVFGYVDYLSVITIDGFPNIRFMAIEHKYDALANITSLKLKEILNDAGGVDYTNITYLPTYDYGNVVEPTIK